MVGLSPDAGQRSEAPSPKISINALIVAASLVSRDARKELTCDPRTDYVELAELLGGATKEAITVEQINETTDCCNKLNTF